MLGRDPFYAAATVALLDALIVLGPHVDAITLVGAQAVYLRVGDADIAVAPTTTDADLALNPEILGVDPALEGLMRAAGFELRRDSAQARMPGIWEKRLESGLLVQVDLLVPAAMSATNRRRAAPMVGHEDRVAMKAKGIEGALVDAEVLSVEDDSGRESHVRVAGVGALLVAKIHKILDRTQTSGRLVDKDALDVARLLRGTSTAELARRVQIVVADRRSHDVAEEALAKIVELFGRPTGEGVLMAIRATEGLMRGEEMSSSLNTLTADLMKALGRQ